MPTEPVGFPQMGSQMGSGLQGGFQLIRDPAGQILVLQGNVIFRRRNPKYVTQGKNDQNIFSIKD